MKSASECLQAINWERIETTGISIFMKTYLISDEQYNVLYHVFKSSLGSQFRLPKDDEIGFYFRGQFSITIFKNRSDPFWSRTGKNMRYYSDNLIELFDFKKSVQSIKSLN